MQWNINLKKDAETWQLFSLTHGQRDVLSYAQMKRVTTEVKQDDLFTEIQESFQ